MKKFFLKSKKAKYFSMLFLVVSVTGSNAITITSLAETTPFTINDTKKECYEKQDITEQFSKNQLKIDSTTKLLYAASTLLVTDTNKPAITNSSGIAAGSSYTSVMWENYKKSVTTDINNLKNKLIDYNNAAKAYINSAEAYNLTASIPIDIKNFQLQLSNNNKRVITLESDASNILSKNFTSGDNYSNEFKDFSKVLEAYSAYNTSINKQNSDQVTLQDIVATFPMQSSISGEPEATDALQSWENQYCAAVLDLQLDITNTNDTQKRYNTELETYNKHTSNKNFVSGSLKKFIEENTAQNYLSSLQTATNLSDLTSGSGVIPVAINKYLQNQSTQNTFNNMITSEQTFLDDASQMSTLFYQLKNEIVDNYSSTANTTNASILSIQNGKFTLDDVTNFLTFISKSNNILSKTQIIKDQMLKLTPQISADYQNFISEATAYNQLPRVSDGTYPSLPIGNGSSSYALYQWLNGSVLEQSSLNGLEGQLPPKSTQWTTDYDVVNNAILNISQSFSAAGYGSAYSGSGEDFSIYVQNIFKQYGWGDINNLTDWISGPVGEYALNASTPPTTWSTPQKPNVSLPSSISIDTTYNPIEGKVTKISPEPKAPDSPTFYQVDGITLLVPVASITTSPQKQEEPKELPKKSILPTPTVTNKLSLSNQQLPKTGEETHLSYKLTLMGIIATAFSLIIFFIEKFLTNN